MVREVDVWDYAGHIMKNIDSGILLTTAWEGKVNTMTIGWGKIGVVWSRPVFEVLVRESRYTKEFLDKTGGPRFSGIAPDVGMQGDLSAGAGP